MIRLSTAHARARLSNTVEERDANAAIQLVQFAYFKRILEKEKKKRRRQENGESSGDEGFDDNDVDRNEDNTRRPKRTRKNPGEEGYDPYDIENDVESQAEESQRVTRAQKTQEQVPPTEASSGEATTMEIDEPVEINDERLVSVHQLKIKSFCLKKKIFLLKTKISFYGTFVI